jgi:hypothetical protein
LSADLNRELPATRYYAMPTRHLGIEIDVAALERYHDPAAENGFTWTPRWSAPAATATVPFAPATDELEVRVYEESAEEGLRIVGAIELVSPANKDRPEHRSAFVSKCHGLLQKGIGVVIVDVVTDKHFNLHNELMTRLGNPELRIDGHLYATSYRPTGKRGAGELAVWTYSLAVGAALPTVPFWLYGGIHVPARLEETYDRTCRELRVYDLLGMVVPEPAQPDE